jgi:hypothetical protein
MTLDIAHERGTPLERQTFDWRDLVRAPYSKLDDDAFTRVRALLATAVEADAVRFGLAAAREDRSLELAIARVRKIEQLQRTLVASLMPPDQSALETTIAVEQTSVEVTASAAAAEPDAYVKRVYDFGLLEDLDHLYRFAALLDRTRGKDANAVTQCYTDIRPGRPTHLAHRAPEDVLRAPYDRATAAVVTKLGARVVRAVAAHALELYAALGPTVSDPIGRQLYAEIGAIEEQHVAEYGALCDPDEALLERWLLQEASEVYVYYGCLRQETNARIKPIWARFLDYELGHLHVAREAFQRVLGRDPASVVPDVLPEPPPHAGHREYVREVLASELHFVANGREIGPSPFEPAASRELRDRLNAAGSPSQSVAAGWRWRPGTELSQRIVRTVAEVPR